MSQTNQCEPKDYFETPPDLFEELNKEFQFDLDACATDANTKVKSKYFTEVMDALTLDWHLHGKTIFCNPPYSKKGKKDLFIAKAAEAADKGSVVVMVLPAKTNTKAFHRYIWDAENHLPRLGVQIRYPKGRPRFYLNGQPTGGGQNEIMIVVFRPKNVFSKGMFLISKSTYELWRKDMGFDEGEKS